MERMGLLLLLVRTLFAVVPSLLTGTAWLEAGVACLEKWESNPLSAPWSRLRGGGGESLRRPSLRGNQKGDKSRFLLEGWKPECCSAPLPLRWCSPVGGGGESPSKGASNPPPYALSGSGGGGS